MGIPAPTAIGPLVFDTPRAIYYLVFFFLVVGVWVMRRIVDSLMGRTFMAIRNGDELAEALGVNLMRNKLIAFLLSVLYAGLAGALYAGFVRFLGPDLAGVEHTFDMTMYMVIGGLGTVLGPLLGAIMVPWVTQYLQFLQEYRFLIFGPVLVLLVIFLPNGIVGTWVARRARKASARDAANLAVPGRAANLAADGAAGGTATDKEESARA